MRLRNWFLALWVGFLPLAAIFSKSIERIVERPEIEAALIIFWVAAFIFVAVRLTFWRCPRCGDRFMGQKWYGPDLAAWKCGSCGLERPSFRKTPR